MGGHRFQRKAHADYAIAAYGSELAGDILNCEVCGRPYEEHDHGDVETKDKGGKAMKREEALKLIDREREAQDREWPRDAYRRQLYSTIPPHILLLEEQVAKLRSDWYRSEREDCLDRIVKTAAIALRALEEIVPEGCPVPYSEKAA